mgnify:CR=1 FL=1
MFNKTFQQLKTTYRQGLRSLSNMHENLRAFVREKWPQKPEKDHEPEDAQQPETEDPQQIKPETPRQYSVHPCPEYMNLKIRFRDIGRLSAIAETIGRDYLTYMPEGAASRRLGQIAYLYRRLHEDLVSGDVAHDLELAREHKQEHPEEWDAWDSANLNQMNKIYVHSRNIPADLEEDRARLSYNGRRVHRECLRNNDWKSARSFLQEVTDMHCRLAEARARGTNTNSGYQALMSEYLPDTSIMQINDWFTELETKLGDLLPKVLEKQKKDPLPRTWRLSATEGLTGLEWLGACRKRYNVHGHTPWP